MRRRTLTFLIAAGLATSLAPPTTAAAPDGAGNGSTIVLRAARLFAATSDQEIPDGTIVVRDGKIAQVGSRLPVPAGAEVVDLGNATLLPGFIDAHVHLTIELGASWYLDFYRNMLRFPAEQALYAASYAKKTLEAGFTTVRNVGADDFVDVGLRNAINAGITEGPRMLTAVHAIGSTGGHADQAPFPPDVVSPAGPIEGVCNGPAECRAAVRYQIKYGADVIKFMPSGGVLSESDPVDVPELTQEEMNAIVSEAHAWKRKVAAHCHGDQAAKMAIAAGVDSIEHGTFLAPDTLRMMKEKGVYLVPTRMAAEWVHRMSGSYPPQIAAKANAAWAAHAAMMAKALEIGVPIAFGTDAGVYPHGLNAQEFALLTQAGMSPASALRSATSEASKLLGLAAETGTLEPGKAADVVAVPGDPLADIRATEHPILVMKGGAIVVGKR